MKEVVLQLECADGRKLQKAKQKVYGIQGVESVHTDPMDKKMTVTGDVDVVSMVSKLRKLCHTEILSVTSIEEETDEPNKDDDPDPGQTSEANQPLFYDPYYFQSPYPQSQAAVPAEAYHVADDDPNSCVIC